MARGVYERRPERHNTVRRPPGSQALPFVYTSSQRRIGSADGREAPKIFPQGTTHRVLSRDTLSFESILLLFVSSSSRFGQSARLDILLHDQPRGEWEVGQFQNTKDLLTRVRAEEWHHGVVIDVKGWDTQSKHPFGQDDGRCRDGQIGQRPRQSQQQRSRGQGCRRHRGKRKSRARGGGSCSRGRRTAGCDGEDAIIEGEAKEGPTQESEHTLVPSKTTKSILNAAPVDVAGLASKVTRRWIGQGKLANPKSRGRRIEPPRCEGDTREEIKAPCEFAFHFVFAEALSEHPVQDGVHPTKAFSVPEQFHE